MACLPPVPFSCAPDLTAQTGPGNTPVIFVRSKLLAFSYYYFHSYFFETKPQYFKFTLALILNLFIFSYKFHFELEKFGKSLQNLQNVLSRYYIYKPARH